MGQDAHVNLHHISEQKEDKPIFSEMGQNTH